jgi:hypothetical protein
VIDMPKTEELDRGRTTSDADDAAIRNLLNNWVMWRDTGDWDRLAGAWHSEGRMIATWFEGPADQFIRASRAASEAGIMSAHVLGGVSVTLAGNRAIGNTRMTLHLRTMVDGELCDISCLGRFYDFLEKRDERWGIVLRQPIYEKDRLDPVRPGARLTLDQALLDQFPPGYRHIAYAQTRAGIKVSRDLPGGGDPSLGQLYARGERWLNGSAPV